MYGGVQIHQMDSVVALDIVDSEEVDCLDLGDTAAAAGGHVDLECQFLGYCVDEHDDDVDVPPPAMVDTHSEFDVSIGRVLLLTWQLNDIVYCCSSHLACP